MSILICPGCEYEIGNKKLCPKCGYNTKIYNKAKRISAIFYNKGLKFINNGCISQGIKFLEKSIEFDKRNITARNLLGLAYIYLGRISDALKHWSISVHMSKDNNLAVEYIEEAQKNKAKLAKYDEAITMFNEALSYIKEKNEDMSIIRLKKALNLSENFLEAHKLLVLCYIMQGNYEKAMYALDKAMKLDYNNEDLINYYKILNPDSTIVKQNTITEKQKIQKVYMKPNSNTTVNKKKLVKSMTILFGVIFLAGFLASMLFSTVFSTELKKVKEDNKKYIIRLAEDEAKIKQMKAELDASKERVGLLQDEKSSTDQVKFLNQADELYKNGNIEQAAIKIKLVSKSDLDTNLKIKYEEIYNNTVPVIAKMYYEKAKKFYDSGKHEDAIINFEKSFYYSMSEIYSDDALYYAGLSYEEKGDKTKALESMTAIIKDYKDSDKYEKASLKKTELEK